MMTVVAVSREGSGKLFAVSYGFVVTITSGCVWSCIRHSLLPVFEYRQDKKKLKEEKMASFYYIFMPKKLFFILASPLTVSLLSDHYPC